MRTTDFFKDNTREMKGKNAEKENVNKHFSLKFTNKTSRSSYLYKTNTQSSTREEETHWQSTGRGGRKMQGHEGESETADRDPEPRNKTVKAGMAQSEQNERGQREQAALRYVSSNHWT